MATTIDGYSLQLAQVQPPNYEPLKPNEEHGRVRLAKFSYVFASEVAGLDLALCVIPKGARILHGTLAVSATMGSTTISIGLMGKDLSGFVDVAGTDADDVAQLLAAVAITTTAKVPFAATQALGYLYEAEKELYLTLTTAAATAGTQILTGHVEYVVD